jgi:rhodanese-related sulfurtransferase
MTPRLTPLAPKDAAELLSSGAVLVDIREPDEFARRHVKGALWQPLSRITAAAKLDLPVGRKVVFTCRSGMRTQANCDRLAEAVEGEAFVLQGGIDAWAAAGLPVVEDRKAPLELIRQVQIAAGLLVLSGVGFGFAIHPAFFGLSAFVGAGLTFAGLTGTCAMARLLSLAPWNRPVRA